jgi:hypothetical protein
VYAGHQQERQHSRLLFASMQYTPKCCLRYAGCHADAANAIE